MKRLKKNDQVYVISGDFKGFKSKIIDLKGDYVILENVQKKKRFVRKNKQFGIEEGYKIEVNRKIHQSNVMLVCPKTDKPTKITYLKEGNKKTRVTKKGQVKIDWQNKTDKDDKNKIIKK